MIKLTWGKEVFFIDLHWPIRAPCMFHGNVFTELHVAFKFCILQDERRERQASKESYSGMLRFQDLSFQLCAWFYFNYIKADSFKDLLPELYLPIQPFRMPWPRCQLSNELSQHIVTGRQIMPASSPVTKPIFLFPLCPQLGILHYNSAMDSDPPSPR